ncbi:hypothetical protein LJR225_005093 [Phenylobacterium sp. LjRoot225]|uniref:hypothetical protein n=1 Tax=Phenylobacterium sp. LjRoot225 TaxID=3342285 RepID=UPI003ECFF3F3
MVLPRAIQSAGDFPHRSDIVGALNAGATCRQDERRLSAEELLGIYEIRLRIALDTKLNEGMPPAENQLASDLTGLLENLRGSPTDLVTAFYIHAPNCERFTFFESAATGTYLGCIRSYARNDK